MEFYDLKLFLPELLLIFSSIIILIYGIFFNKKKESLKNVFYITFLDRERPPELGCLLFRTL